MAELSLTEHDIHRWVGEASFGRGLSYYHSGTILQPNRQGQTLHANCSGTEKRPYRLWVTLDAQGIVKGNCTCYVGAGGRCKHVAALLLTWLHAPERFLEQATRAISLEQRSKAELVALIERMLARYPDLASLLDVPSVVDTETLPPLDAAVLEKQVDSAFYGGDDWGPSKVRPEELAQVAQLGDAYAAQARWDEARQVYQAVLKSALHFCDRAPDEAWELETIVDDCVYSLEECLKGAETTQRDPVLRALFDVYCWSAEHSSAEMGSGAGFTLLEESTAEEKQRIAGWVRGVMPSLQSTEKNPSAGYLCQAHSGFLIELQADTLDDEEYLRLCREMERWHDLTQRLIELARIEEACTVAREQDEGVLLAVAEGLGKAGHGELAYTLVQERTLTSRDWRLPRWLKQYAIASGDLEGAARIVERQFWQRPDQGGYEELRDLGRQLGQWEVRRGALLARLGEEGQQELLTEIHLQENEPDRALEALGPVLARRWGGSELALRVAEAVEEPRPRAALMLYAWLAERAIGSRNRSAYAIAAHRLTLVRTLYHRLGEPEAWLSYIADLRQQHRRLRAFLDELNKAGIE